MMLYDLEIWTYAQHLDFETSIKLYNINELNIFINDFIYKIHKKIIT